jgi:hypothetical protein
MNQNEAFIDSPPMIDGVELKPLTVQISQALTGLFSKKDVTDQVWVGAYFLLASMDYRTALKLLKSDDIEIECMAAVMELDQDEYQSIIEYISRVVDRRAAAAVEVAESPGKQD